jgi:TorA maturation chaperone TorD
MSEEASMSTVPFSEEQAVIPIINDQDAARADIYGLLAGLLREPPTDEVLMTLRGISPTGPDNDLGKAWKLLRLAAEHADPSDVDDEFHELFIGLVAGELMPYASWYQTGFLMERPLSELRDDLRRLGFAREDGVSEPEDHAAALCEVMAWLCTDPAFDIPLQRQFFEHHLAPWIGRFYTDLETARSACFYRSVGRLGNAFLPVERDYLGGKA